MAGKILRFWEVDAARGVAVLMMILFHALFDLWYFMGFNVILDSGFWLVFARATLIIFLLLVGISLSLSHSRVSGMMKGRQITRKYVRRGLRIFGYGLAITAVTLIAFPQSAIWFGVLHLIGISIILAIPVLSHRKAALPLGVILVLAGVLLMQLIFNYPWLLPLGLLPAGFYTFDYVPILPWFGVVLLGLFFGGAAYKKRKPKPSPTTLKPLCFIGRHSLFIYLTHQLVLVGCILALLSF